MDRYDGNSWQPPTLEEEEAVEKAIKLKLNEDIGHILNASEDLIIALRNSDMDVNQKYEAVGLLIRAMSICEGEISSEV